MNWQGRFRYWIAALFSKRRLEREMAEEMREHLELRTERYIQSGMSPEEACRAAQRGFGGVDQLKERCRDQRGWMWLENLWRDVRQAVYRLVRRPAATVAMVLTLAVALGINSAVMSIARAVLFRAASPAEGSRLCSVFLATKDAERRMRPFSYREIEAMRASPEVFAEVGAFAFEVGVVRADGDQDRSFLAFVDDGFFRAHQLKPLEGRFFSAAEAKPGAGVPVVVVSAEFVAQQDWTLAQALGRTVQVNGVPVTVVGVTPPGFNGLTAMAGPKLWLPLGMDRAAMRMLPENTGLDHPDLVDLFPIALLRPGLTRETAAAALDVVSARLPRLPDDPHPCQLLMTPMRRFGLGPTPEPRAPVLFVVGCALAMAGLVLAVACFNLASLQLARANLRRKEVAIRLALGAGRGRILAALLVEDFLVALAGGGLGLLFSIGAGQALTAHIQNSVPNNMAFTASAAPDAWSVALTFAGCLGATLLFGLRPAVALTRTDLLTAIKSSATNATSISPQVCWWPRNLLMGLQTALAVVLVFGAVLFFFGLRRAVKRDPGFRVENRFVAELDFGALRWADDRIQRALRGLADDPGALAVAKHYAFGTILPYGDWNETIPLQRSDAPDGKVRQQEGTLSRIGPGYFATLGIPLLRGRDIVSADLTGPDPAIVPVVIDERMTRELFGEEDPIGRLVLMGGGQKAQVVGVCGSHWMNPLAERPCCWVFIPARQVRSVYLYVHAEGEGIGAGSVVALLRQRMAQIDSTLVATEVRPMEKVIIASPQLSALWMANCLFGSCGLVAALLAVVGVYAVKSYLVARRSSEIGIRIALGARAGQVQRLVLGQALRQSAIACSVGAGLAMLLSHPLGGLLNIDRSTGGVLVLASAGTLYFAALAAAWLPARRAAKVNPIVALRME
jgi:predicted permease